LKRTIERSSRSERTHATAEKIEDFEKPLSVNEKAVILNSYVAETPGRFS